jgi:hypothetical protein
MYESATTQQHRHAHTVAYSLRRLRHRVVGLSYHERDVRERRACRHHRRRRVGELSRCVYTSASHTCCLTHDHTHTSPDPPRSCCRTCAQHTATGAATDTNQAVSSAPVRACVRSNDTIGTHKITQNMHIHARTQDVNTLRACLESANSSPPSPPAVRCSTPLSADVRHRRKGA